MPPPKQWPRDGAGNTLPHDHPEIGADDFVIRYTTQNDLAFDDATKTWRLGSGAFSESSDANGGMSSPHEGWMTEAGLDVMHYAKDPAAFGAVRIRVGDLRTAGFQVGYDPLPGNPYHCAVWGLGTGSKRKRVRRIATTVKKCKGED